MPRPTDSYTHSQFEQIDSANLGGTVQCIHCKRWQGSAKVLNRKKAHLQVCPYYAEWRAAGNGQKLAPPNPYNATGRRGFDDSQSTDKSSPTGTGQAPTMQRPRSSLDLSKYFHEFFDDTLGHKCARVRCQSCGFVRAKNATRQAEHLVQCKEFLATAEGAELMINGSLALSEQHNHLAAIWTGVRPNPDLLVNRRGARAPRGGTHSDDTASQSLHLQVPQATETPSLAQHLLLQAEGLLTSATRHPFLSHAGCGSLSENALNQWLAQIGYISRSLVSFTGALIGKIRIPETADLDRDPTFRCLDLLCSAVNNMKKELEFLEATKRKFRLEVAFDEPRPATKGFIDLFNSASFPSATLLEGMVMLWAVEILFFSSFSYAGTFLAHSTSTPQQMPYSMPSPASASPVPVSAYEDQSKSNSSHTTALHEAFIKNWKSENFGRFVDACKAIVDELAMAQTRGNGRVEMSACERVFKQAVWLWSQIFPDITEVDDQTRMDISSNHNDRGGNVVVDVNGSANRMALVDAEDHLHAAADAS